MEASNYFFSIFQFGSDAVVNDFQIASKKISLLNQARPCIRKECYYCKIQKCERSCLPDGRDGRSHIVTLFIRASQNSTPARSGCS